MEQALWFYNNDIIIAAHGAAMTWAAFIQPCTVIIQIYPAHYYPIDFYERLILESGGIPMSWWHGAYIGVNETQLNISRSNAIMDFKNNILMRGSHRAKNIHVPTDIINKLVTHATMLRINCLQQLRQ